MRAVPFVLLALPGWGAADPYTCVQASNFLNAQYTVPVGVGTPPQEFMCVMDTGSFELMVASSECTGCARHRKFVRSESSTTRPKSPQEYITTVFGQGSVVSEAVYEQAQVGNLSVPAQSVLLMQNNELRDYADASYDGIVGLGVASAAREADSDLSLMAHLGVDDVSICFGQYDGEPGRVEFGSEPGAGGVEYRELPILGDSHWALELSSVAMLAADGRSRTPISGCDEPSSCNAIIDSGTSLVAVPPSILNTILEKIGDIDPNCRGVDALPTLELTLGSGSSAYTIELPPQLYVARMEIEDDDAPSTRLAQASEAALTHLSAAVATGSAVAAANATNVKRWDPFHQFRRRLHTQLEAAASNASYGMLPAASGASGAAVLAAEEGEGRQKEACVALFMEMELSSSLGGIPWILGLPLMRAYKAKFSRRRRTVGLAQLPLGSEHCTSCAHTAFEAPSKPHPCFPAARKRRTSLNLALTEPEGVALEHGPRATEGAAAAAAHDARATDATAAKQAAAAATMGTDAPQPPPLQSADRSRTTHGEERSKRLRMSMRHLAIPRWVRQAQYTASRGRPFLH